MGAGQRCVVMHSENDAQVREEAAVPRCVGLWEDRFAQGEARRRRDKMSRGELSGD